MLSQLFVVSLVGLAVGCASVRLVARENDLTEKEILIERCGWNLDEEDETKEVRVGERETIGSVKVHMNYLYAIGAVLSLGHWMPFDITYEVNK